MSEPVASEDRPQDASADGRAASADEGVGASPRATAAATGRRGLRKLKRRAEAQAFLDGILAPARDATPSPPPGADWRKRLRGLFLGARNARPAEPPLVKFLLCGAQKSGTTALFAQLLRHPEICGPVRKELHFFDTISQRGLTLDDYSVYHGAFPPEAARRMAGEATPAYMYVPGVPRLLHAYNPALKLIVVLRNPIERAYSHWNHMTQEGEETLPFYDALRQEPARLLAALPRVCLSHSYLDRGRYVRQLERLWSFFPRSQVHILRSDELRSRPREVLRDVFRFLGVAPSADTASRTVHARKYAAPMSSRERRYLQEVFEPEIRDLELALGWDCSDWLSGT